MADHAVLAAADAAAETYQFRLWGAFAAAGEDGRDLTPRGRKARALLAYLLIERRPIDRDRLAGLLWSERGHAQARASVRQCLVELHAFTRGDAPLLRVDRHHVAFDTARARTDLDEIMRLAGAGEAEALAETLAGDRRALLEDMDGIDPAFDEWLQPIRAERGESLLAAAQRCTARALDDGRAAQAARLAQRLQAIDPLDEAAARLAMASAHALGRQEAVRRIFGRLAHDLKEELAVGPSPETRALHDCLAAAPRAPAADAAPPPAAALAAEARLRGARRRGWAWLAAAVLLLVLGAAVVLLTRQQAAAEPATLAVLPFRNLAPGDDHFAEGLSEEVIAQLGREPGLRVAGRTSSWQFREGAPDPAEVGRKLDVSYILEGSVRSVGDKVRVNVALVHASDGMQLWAETFDGTLDDVLSIQHRIGANVADALKLKLVQASPRAGRHPTSGQAYSLYLTARGLIRERNPPAMANAKAKLLRAVVLDPGFAPAWSSLAQATHFESNAPGPQARHKRDEAIAHARKALALAPDLAEAHGVLGMILGFDDPVGQRHVKRAAALDPGSAEFQFWLGHVLANEGDFPRMLAAYRKAFEIDPLWRYAQFQIVDAAWSMGRHEEAAAAARRVEQDSSRHEARMIRATLAKARGDYSAAAAELAAAAAATQDPGRIRAAAYQRAFILFSLGLLDEARGEWSKVWDDGGNVMIRPERMDEYDVYFALRRGDLPSLVELRAHSLSTFHKDRSYAAIGAKMLINAGRARDVVALHDGAGFLGVGRTMPPARLDHLTDGVIVAAALRAVGRTADADAILVRLDRMIAAGLGRSRGQAPAPFLAEAAAVWAMRGKHDAALAALEKARRRGWVYVEPNEGDTSLGDIGHEPAFRSLRGTPRFERLRAELNAHRAKERREVAARL